MTGRTKNVGVITQDDALQWGLRYARATRLPIEVRPFQGKSTA